MTDEQQRHAALQVILEDLETGVAGVDRDGRLLCANGAFYVRLAASGLVGEVAPAELRQRLRRKGLRDCCEILEDPPDRVRGRDGRTYRIVVTRHEDGPVAMILQILHPNCSEGCSRGGGEAFARSNLGQDLLRRFAHETRTMLTNIAGFAELIRTMGKGGADNSQVEEWTGHIRDSADLILKELGHLVDLVDATSEDDDLHDEECMTLRELLEALESEVSVRCQFEESDRGGLRISGDQNRLAAALGILCARLVRALPGAKVRVSLGEDKDHAVIELARILPLNPDGREMPDERRKSGTAGEDGVFALPLARAIIARHGGTVEYSEWGGGEARYRVRLPKCELRAGP